MAIEANNLVKRFGTITAVDGVTFEVKSGEFFGFLGPNGAGKTTTIHMLCTLLKPTSGSARIKGYDCTREARDVRNAIGLVFQETTLDKDLTVYENLLLTCYLYNLKRREAQGRIGEIMKVLEIADRRGDLVKTLSGGLKRRVDIARGILHHPRVLFLDEPTIGLDPQARIAIWDMIDRLREQQHMTVFLTTHYLDEAERCDRVAIIDHGKIIALGSPEELKRTIRGEVIHLKTTDDPGVEEEIRKQFETVTKRTQEGLFLEVDSAETFLPPLLRSLGGKILAINITRPSLNDVFIHLTGRAIR
ncbi:MAG: ATP-binding cassette domain-containing protein [candidate division NC10 bacterium]|nr:ATP-binding cassette domain-containing protein [candidate division NC10 bacterium]